eukprot:9503690-Alexandrium_andersonii.AAC.1
MGGGGAPAACARPGPRRCFWQLGDGFCRNCSKHNFRKNRCCVHCGVGSEQFFAPESFAQAQQYLLVIRGVVGWAVSLRALAAVYLPV